jgi:hypothetical protein
MPTISKPTLAPEPPEPTPILLSQAHRMAARARGHDLDATVALLKGALTDASLLLQEILKTSPVDDVNRKILEAKIRRFRGELQLFAP